MNYSLITIWQERQRFLPAVLAVGFSALLIALQGGLLLGLLKLMSTPVDHAPADVWVGHPEVLSVDLGRPVTVRVAEVSRSSAASRTSCVATATTPPARV